MDEDMQKRLWGILIENELYQSLKFSRDDKEREQFIKRFSVQNNIPVDFIKEKIEKMNQTMNKIKGEDYGER